MIRSALSFFASIFIFAATTFATEPFTVFEGKDASTPKQPQACLSSDGAVHITFGLAIRFSIAKSKTINAQLRNLPFESPICHWACGAVPASLTRGQVSQLRPLAVRKAKVEMGHSSL